jgi:hypothetical protein
MAQPRPSLLEDRAGVSAVIGTVLVLAITVLGIASILYWGAPTIDRIQSRNAQTSMEGEFEGLRDASQELSVPDHSRFPTVAVPTGSLAVQQGTRFMVTVDYDGDATSCSGVSCKNCDFHVTDWSDSGANAAKVAVAAGGSGCRTAVNCGAGTPAAGQACLEVYSVGVTSLVKQTITATANCPLTPTATACTAPVVQTPAPAVNVDFSQGDWMFQLTDASTTTTPTVYAQAWLHSTDQVSWKLTSTTGNWEEYLDGGAIFSRSGSTYFLEKEAAIGDTSFGPSYVGFWLRTLKATAYSAIDGQGSHQVFLSLKGNSVRADIATAYRLRYDFSGALAQPWCNALLFRSAHLTNGGTPPLFTAVYKDDTTNNFSCASGGTGDSLGLRSVCYIQFAAAATAPANPCTSTTGTPFRFRFLHARIDASLSI